jgi:hypothetical protein
MKLPSAPVQAAVNADLKSTRGTRLQGPWLALLRLVWIILSLLALLLFFVSLPVFFASLQKSYTLGYAMFLLALGIFVALVWFIVALLIFWRKSDDWLALLVSLMLVLQGTVTTIYPLDEIPSVWLLPAVILDMLAFFLLFLVFCLFPTGRFVPRWIVWLAVMFEVVWLGALIVGFFNLLPKFFNPLFSLALYCFLGGFVIAQLYRYHAVSSRTERQQSKWIVFGVTATYLLEFAYNLGSELFPSFFSTGSLANEILLPISNAVPILIPLSFGFAILRSRLWEIDVIINRTLVYGTLTTLLVLVYFAGVIGLQFLLHGFTESNQLAIVGSTVLIYALFQPLRQLIQRNIDRRFYRRKYNAARTLEAFSADLRDEVDLNTLKERLVAVVEETMQPAHISLWLRNPEASMGQTTRLLPRINEESVEK